MGFFPVVVAALSVLLFVSSFLGFLSGLFSSLPCLNWMDAVVDILLRMVS